MQERRNKRKKMYREGKNSNSVKKLASNYNSMFTQTRLMLLNYHYDQLT